jgi:hypothetical protein
MKTGRPGGTRDRRPMVVRRLACDGRTIRGRCIHGGPFPRARFGVARGDEKRASATEHALAQSGFFVAPVDGDRREPRLGIGSRISTTSFPGPVLGEQDALPTRKGWKPFQQCGRPGRLRRVVGVGTTSPPGLPPGGRSPRGYEKNASEVGALTPGAPVRSPGNLDPRATPIPLSNTPLRRSTNRAEGVSNPPSIGCRNPGTGVSNPFDRFRPPRDVEKFDGNGGEWSRDVARRKENGGDGLLRVVSVGDEVRAEPTASDVGRVRSVSTCDDTRYRTGGDHSRGPRGWRSEPVARFGPPTRRHLCKVVECGGNRSHGAERDGEGGGNRSHLTARGGRPLREPMACHRDGVSSVLAIHEASSRVVFEGFGPARHVVADGGRDVRPPSMGYRSDSPVGLGTGGKSAGDLSGGAIGFAIRADEMMAVAGAIGIRAGEMGRGVSWRGRG